MTKGKFVNGKYNVPIKEGSKIYENIGAVKKKNDGRYEWWRWPSEWHNNWEGDRQGVCYTIDEAQANVLDGWQGDRSDESR